MKLKHIPNVLSVLRIILVFVFIAVFLIKRDELWWSMIVFFVAGVTDVIDGFLARKFNWISDLGKILDPLADKLMQCTVLICLCLDLDGAAKMFPIIPVWFALPFFLKELTTLILGVCVIKRRSVVIVSKWYGKAAVCLFYATILLATIIRPLQYGNPWLETAFFLPAVLMAIAAFGAYFQNYSVLIKKDVKKGKIKDIIKDHGDVKDAQEENCDEEKLIKK